jgi:hypothetical protein
MTRNPPDDSARTDQDAGAAEYAARRRLLDRGAADLAPRPWQPPPVPPSAVDLLRHHLWRTGRSSGGPDEAAATAAALGLLSAARAEVDQIETALLFTARAQGMTWAQVAAALGLGSAQAAQQRSDRLGHRVAGDG